MIDVWYAVAGTFFLAAVWGWVGYRQGIREERRWWTMAADTDYHMRNVDDRDYTVLHASYFVDRYHNPLARYRQAEKTNPLYKIEVKGHFP